MSKPIDKELLPCPFCGGKPTVSNFPSSHNIWCSNQPVKCGNRSMYKLDERQARASVQPPGVAVPEGWRLVPLAFIQGFGNLAHNYSLRAVPPDYYDGRAGDAFSDAYARCGKDLARLRTMLAAAPHPVSGEQKLAAQDVAGLVDILQRMMDQQHSLGRDSVLIREADAALANHRAQQGAHKPSPSFVVSLPVPVKPEEPDEVIDDSWMDAYNSAMRMRADLVAAIEQAGGQVVQGEQA